MTQEKRNPGAVGAAGASERFCLAAEHSEDSHLPLKHQASFGTAGPSPEAVAEAEEFLLDEIYHALGLIASYTASALEAARRGDLEELRLRLRVQLRDCFRYAVEIHNLLPARKASPETGRSAA